MLNKSKLTALLVLVLVFIAGIAAAWGAHEFGDRKRDGRRRGRGPDAMVAYLARELDLSAAQRDSLRAIFARHRPATESLWAEVRPRFDSLKARVRADIDAQLTPEQRERHRRLIERAEHHRKDKNARGRREETN
ncbi:MAG: periplasmic heavy metal sensor [Gemmatimonadales bacterium]